MNKQYLLTGYNYIGEHLDYYWFSTEEELKEFIKTNQEFDIHDALYLPYFKNIKL